MDKGNLNFQFIPIHSNLNSQIHSSFQYEWSNRAKSREMLKHVHAALDSTSNGTCSATEGAGDEDENYEKLLVN
jgi:hypothetical protein